MSDRLSRSMAGVLRAYRAGRLGRWLGTRLRRPFLVPAAWIWRRLLFRTTFVAVAGSVGKTTSKELIFAVLRTQYPCVRSRGTLNNDFGLPLSILTVRPWHRYAVMEVAIGAPGDMAKRARLFSPDIAVLLDIKGCHLNTFKTLEALADEKVGLLRRLRTGGTGVVNLDNPLITKWLPDLDCHIVGFGSDAAAAFRLVTAAAVWPRRLAMTVAARGREQAVETQLVGSHWSSSVLAALAVADLCGIDAAEAAAAIAKVPPFWARLQPVTLPNGATILRDEWQGAFDTSEAAWTVMRDADAARKVVVFSDYSQTNRKNRVRANHLGGLAAELAEMAVFVGSYAERAAIAAIAAGLDSDAVHACETVAEASAVLRETLRPGDLVLLKGPSSHHLSRVHLGLIGPVTCRREDCTRIRLCDQCPDLGFSWSPERAGLMAPPDSGL